MYFMKFGQSAGPVIIDDGNWERHPTNRHRQYEKSFDSRFNNYESFVQQHFDRISFDGILRKKVYDLWPGFPTMNGYEDTSLKYFPFRYIHCFATLQQLLQGRKILPNGSSSIGVNRAAGQGVFIDKNSILFVLNNLSGGAYYDSTVKKYKQYVMLDVYTIPDDFPGLYESSKTPTGITVQLKAVRYQLGGERYVLPSDPTCYSYVEEIVRIFYDKFVECKDGSFYEPACKSVLQMRGFSISETVGQSTLDLLIQPLTAPWADKQQKVKNFVSLEPDIRDYMRSQNDNNSYVTDMAGLAYDMLPDFKFCDTNYIETVVEMKQVTHTFGFVTDVAKAAKSARKLDVFTALKHLNDAFLSVSYGLKPLIGDSKSLEKGFEQAMRHFSQRRVRRSKKLFHDNFDITLGLTVYYSTKEVFVQGALGLLDEYRLKLSEWGLDPTNAANWWDLIPFSFVVDWFINVGPRFEALYWSYNSPNANYSIVASIETVKIVSYGKNVSDVDPAVYFRRTISTQYPFYEKNYPIFNRSDPANTIGMGSSLIFQRVKR